MAGELNTSLPISTFLVSKAPPELRGLKRSVIAILGEEHQVITKDSSGGEHLQGTFRAVITGAAFDVAAVTGQVGYNTTNHDIRVHYEATWEPIKAQYVYASTAIDARDNKLINVATPTSSTQLLRVGDFDTSASFTSVANVLCVNTGIVALRTYVNSYADVLELYAYEGGESGSFNNGVIYKYGTVTFDAQTASDGPHTHTFETPFPSSCLYANACAIVASGESGNLMAELDETNRLPCTDISVYFSNANRLLGFSWEAIGY